MTYQQMIELLREVRTNLAHDLKEAIDGFEKVELKRQIDGLKEVMDALDEADRFSASLQYVLERRSK